MFGGGVRCLVVSMLVVGYQRCLCTLVRGVRALWTMWRMGNTLGVYTLGERFT